MLKCLFCAQLVNIKSLCSSESVQKRLEDAGKTTVDLDQEAAGMDSWFDEDILKTIKVTIHQQAPTGDTQRNEEEEEKVEVCGSARLDSGIGSTPIRVWHFHFMPMYVCNFILDGIKMDSKLTLYYINFLY